MALTWNDAKDENDARENRAIARPRTVIRASILEADASGISSIRSGGIGQTGASAVLRWSRARSTSNGGVPSSVRSEARIRGGSWRGSGVEARIARTKLPISVASSLLSSSYAKRCIPPTGNRT